MEASYAIEDRCMHVFLSGALDVGALRQVFDWIAEDPRYDCSIDEVWHMETLDLSAVTWIEVRDLAHIEVPDVKRTPKSVVFLVGERVGLALCKAFAAWVETRGVQMHVRLAEEADYGVRPMQAVRVS